MGLWRLVAHFTRKGGIPQFLWLFLLGLSLSLTMVSCSLSNAQNSDMELTLVSYAVTKPAYQKIIPQFQQQWQKEHNQKVRFNQAYGASGAQTRAVIDGLDADVVNLALALDMKRIEKAGLIAPGWETAPNNAIVTRSVAALVTRENNPLQIRTWQDLTKDGVSVITANPKTSGVARWNFLALWGSQTQTGATQAQARDFISKVYHNVPILPRDAREASDVFFNQGQGDVLINYENELILAGMRGKKSPYIVPEVNISIQNPIAVVDQNVEKHGNREVATAFVEYLYTPAAQREFAKVGFRPVNPIVSQEFADKYPVVKNLFTVKDLGGWSQVQQQYFADGAVFDQIQQKIGYRR